MFKECIFAQRNLHHLGCWNHLVKLAEMFLNTFHREHILLKLKIKSYCEKFGLKTLQLEFKCLIIFVLSRVSMRFLFQIRETYQHIVSTISRQVISSD